MLTYPHCHHCCWGSEHHTDADPGHARPCVLGCPGHEPMPAPEPDLLDLLGLA